jgi:hypothetical protein
MIRRLFPALALLLLTACGSREVIIGGNGAPVPVTSSPTPTMLTAFPGPTGAAEAIERLRAERTDSSARPTKRPDAKRVDYGKMGPADHNTMPLRVTLSATCATPGQAMQATAETLPGAKLAFAAGYSDNDFPPNFTYVPGEGNPTGTFTWTWEITPTTPRGNAVVMVVAGKDDQGASYKAPFRVANSC